jgi:hypothetical protein
MKAGVIMPASVADQGPRPQVASAVAARVSVQSFRQLAVISFR